MVGSTHLMDIVVFYDRTYPQPCSETVLQTLLPGALHFVDAAHLDEQLEGTCRLLVSFHGPYFPKASWQAILAFLERGGNLAIFGGMPFSRPINAAGEVEPEQDAYTRQIYLGPFFPVSVGADPLELVADDQAIFLNDCPLSLTRQPGGTFWACNPKLTQVDDHPEDLGSAGPFDTVLQSLIYAVATTAHGQQRVATPLFLLDQRSGRFQGGRWLISAWKPGSEEDWLANAEALRRAIVLALEGALTMDVHPTLGCYQPGEAPALTITVRTTVEVDVSITVYRPNQKHAWQSFEGHFGTLAFQQEQSLPFPPTSQPGLYRVEATYQGTGGLALMLCTGFWVWDEQQVMATQGKRLSAERDFFTQYQRPFLIYGTTYMDSRVQRKFLHLPNPARWDQDMAAMKAAGINTLRTGIWSAWRELIPIAGFANEAFLRALDAFVMTACRHNLQVIFTFFAFSPPRFEGENPWLDPRSVQAQQDLVARLARRYARVELLSWDLINEPSFGDPAHIFAQRPRPLGDRFEVAAFQRWLAERSTLTELQLRWRHTPADLPTWSQVLPPKPEDFETSVRNTTARDALKVADYTRFSQDMFGTWASHMVAAIRAAGGQTLVGVGQDEAGARPAPQFYAHAVDYTTTHPWWNIDDLLWDMLLDKTPDKPNLIQETGVMLARDIDNRPWRSEQTNANLLERKLILGLMARGAGLIQWLWHTNSYMTSDNENSIGLLRADGSTKPELQVMEAFGRLTRVLEEQLLATPPAPEVWVVIPYAQWFTRPPLAQEGTRQAVRILTQELGVIPQMVGEYHLEALINACPSPHAVILPAVQLLDQRAWTILLRYLHQGGTVLVNGVLGRDAYNLPFPPRIGQEQEELSPEPVARYEQLDNGQGQVFQLSFLEEKMSYVKKIHNRLKEYSYGAGRLIWCGLPLELAAEIDVIRTVYEMVVPSVKEPTPGNHPLLLSRQPLRQGKLLLVVSEANFVQHLTLEEGIQLTIEPNRAGALLLGADMTVMHLFGDGLRYRLLSDQSAYRS